MRLLLTMKAALYRPLKYLEGGEYGGYWEKKYMKLACSCLLSWLLPAGGGSRVFRVYDNGGCRYPMMQRTN